MISYEDFHSGKVAFATPYGREQLTALELSMCDNRTYDVLRKVAYFLRPDKIKAIGLDKRERVVYVAVERDGVTYAGCGSYFVKRTGGVVATSDSFDSESQGLASFRRKCPLCVLEQLSPLSDFPRYDEEQRQRAKQWRQDCLKKILRSRKTSDADKEVARKLLDELKAD